MGLFLIIFLPGRQDNWPKGGLVFWTSVSGHQGLLNMAEIEQKGMFAPSFHLSWVPFSCGAGICSCLSTHPQVWRLGVAFLQSTHSLPKVQGVMVSDPVLLHLVLFVVQADLLPFLLTRECGAHVGILVGEKPGK